MIQLKSITKTYRTGNLVQVALNQVSLNFRDNEFVSILGASGSGKSTLLNIIGGLDRYETGDLIINGVSTNQYKDRDWDTYRNHSIGFVFQSYNLIPHQSVLANVELALTIGGVSGKEKRKAKPGKENLIGVEGMTTEVLLSAFKKAGIDPESGISERTEPFSKTFLFEIGLSGGTNSSEIRKKLCEYYNLPKMLSANSLAEILPIIKTKAELLSAIEKIKEN